jgi:hypothetical protein
MVGCSKSGGTADWGAMICSRSRLGQIGVVLAVTAAASWWALSGSQAPLDSTTAGGGRVGSIQDGDLARVETPADVEAAPPPPVVTDPSAPTPSASQPVTLGDDPVLDDLWHRCGDGSGAACDQLFDRAPPNSDYESFGLSCGNRPDILQCALEMDSGSAQS